MLAGLGAGLPVVAHADPSPRELEVTSGFVARVERECAGSIVAGAVAGVSPNGPDCPTQPTAGVLAPGQVATASATADDGHLTSSAAVANGTPALALAAASTADAFTFTTVADANVREVDYIVEFRATGDPGGYAFNPVVTTVNGYADQALSSRPLQEFSDYGIPFINPGYVIPNCSDSTPAQWDLEPVVAAPGAEGNLQAGLRVFCQPGAVIGGGTDQGVIGAGLAVGAAARSTYGTAHDITVTADLVKVTFRLIP
jgi:hypothetical protein